MKINVIITPTTLLEQIADYSKISVFDLKRKNRKTPFVSIRQLYAYIGSHYYKFLKIDIARELKQNHTTILHSINKVKGFIETHDIDTIETIEKILVHLQYQKSRKREYEAKYDNLLLENINLKREIRKLNTNLELLISKKNSDAIQHY